MEISIKGNSSLIALFGYPVAHSVSPIIHNTAIRNLNLPYCYIPLAIPPQRLQAAIAVFRSCNFVGANITIPHKSAVTHYCDKLSLLSEATGTVNTLYWEGKNLCGTTTDYEGFKKALEVAGVKLEGQKVVIIGNGGTAKTLAIGMGLEKSISYLSIAGRNFLKVSKLAEEVKSVTGKDVDFMLLSDKSLSELLEKTTLLVNCTNVGMHPNIEETPIPAELLHSKLTVFDAIYNPSETKLLREAKKRGCKTENGLRMLLYQGLASFKIWTGVTVKEEMFSFEELYKIIEEGL